MCVSGASTPSARTGLYVPPHRRRLHELIVCGDSDAESASPLPTPLCSGSDSDDESQRRESPRIQQRNLHAMLPSCITRTSSEESTSTCSSSASSGSGRLSVRFMDGEEVIEVAKYSVAEIIGCAADGTCWCWLHQIPPKRVACNHTQLVLCATRLEA